MKSKIHEHTTKKTTLGVRRKTKLTQLVLFLFGMTLILNSCVKEAIQTQHYDNIVLKVVTYADIKENQNLKQSISKIRTKQKESMQNRMVYDSLNEFFFDDSYGKLTEIDGKKSYTFSVYRKDSDDKIENIIFNENENGEYDALFAKYDYSKEEMLNLTQDELEVRDPIISESSTNRVQLCVKYKEYRCVPPNHGDLVGYSGDYDCGWVTVWEICSGSGGNGGGYPHYDYPTGSGVPNDNNYNNPGGLSTSVVQPTQAGEFVSSLGFATIDEFISLSDAVKTIIFTYLYNNNYSNQVVTPTKYALQHFNYLWFSELSESMQISIMNYFTQNNFSTESKNEINEIQVFLAENQNSQEAMEFVELGLIILLDKSEFNFNEFDAFQQFIPDYESKMSQEELEIFNLLPNQRLQKQYLYNAYFATNKAMELFPECNRNNGTSFHNDKADAYRHACFHALNTYYLGYDLSVQLGDAHETDTPLEYLLEKVMDLFNNQKGRDVSQNPPILMNGYGTIKLRIYNAVLNGDLMYLNPINYNDPNYWDNLNTTIFGDGTHGITNSTTLIPTP